MSYDVLCNGYLAKEGGRGHSHKNKQTRYFVLNDLFLYYYETQPKENRKRDKLKGILYVPTLSVKDNPAKTNSFILETKDKEYILYMVDQNADDATKLLDQWRNAFDYVTTRAKELDDLLTLSGPLQKRAKKTYCILRGSTLTHYEGEPSKENDISKMKGWIDLDQVSAIIIEGDPELNKDTAFKLLSVDGKSHLFFARDVDDKKRWVDAITAQIHTLAKHKFATNLGKPISETILRASKFSRSNKSKTYTCTVAVTNLNLRFYNDRSPDAVMANMYKDCTLSVPLYLAFASVEGTYLKVVDFKGDVSILAPLDSTESLKDWENWILQGARAAVERVVKSGGCIRAGCSLVVDDQHDEYAILTITSAGITIDVLKDKSKIEIKESDYKGAEPVVGRSNLFTLTHSGTHRIAAPNASGLCHAIKSGIEKHRKRKTKKSRTGKAKRAASGSTRKARASTSVKKSGSKKLKKHISDAERAKLKVLFEQYDTDKSGSIDKQELRAVIEASMKTKVSEKLLQKYLEVEFQKHDRDGSGAIELDEFCELYSRLYMDPELPIVVSSDDLGEIGKIALETGDNALKIEKRETIMSAAQKTEAFAKFDEYDRDKSGAIDKEELLLLLKDTSCAKMGQRILERFVDAQFQLGDVDGSGTIDKAEFLDLYAKLFFAQSISPGGKPPSKTVSGALPPPIAGSELPPPIATGAPPPPLTALSALPPPLTPPPL